MPKGVLHYIKHTQGFRPGEYVEGSDWIKLNTNENPFAPSPQVIAALQDFIANQGASLSRYPQPWSPGLATALAQFHGLSPEQVLPANGTQELLMGLFRMLVPVGADIGFHEPGYGLYQALTLLHGATPAPVQLSMESPQLDADAIARIQAPVFILSCPHSPTGIRFELNAIRRLLERLKGYLVIDEAYALFAKHTAVELLAQWPNLIITRTFSKSHQMAGARVAYALGNAAVIEQLRKFVDPYAVDRLARVAALAALADNAYTQAKITTLNKTRQRVYEKLLGLGWRTFRSEGNFLLTEPRNALDVAGREVAYCVYEFLKSNKILVRPFDDAWACSYIRLGIGCDQTMDRVLEAIAQWHSM